MRALALGGLLLAFLFTTGCAHYRLGTGSTPPFRTLYVAPVVNKTMLPQSQAILSTYLRETFARDGRISLAVSENTADAVLTITIVDYHRDVAAVREGDTGLARKFNLTLGVLCTLKDRTGKTIFENRPISAVREAFTDGGQLQSEYQTLPLLAESLAGKVAHATLDVW